MLPEQRPCTIRQGAEPNKLPFAQAAIADGQDSDQGDDKDVFSTPAAKRRKVAESAPVIDDEEDIEVR